MSNPVDFWKLQARELSWSKFPTKIIHKENKYIYKWYKDGEMNICYNCVDRHVDEGRGDFHAFLYDSAYTGE